LWGKYKHYDYNLIYEIVDGLLVRLKTDMKLKVMNTGTQVSKKIKK